MMSWTRFFLQFQRDLKLWLFGMVFFQIIRLTFIAFFDQKLMAASGAGEILTAMLGGARYDSIVCSYWTLIPMLGSLTCWLFDWTGFAERLRRMIGSLFVVTATIMGAISIGYFWEFDDIFGQTVFGLYYDDTSAILATIAAEYSLLPITFAVTAVIAVGIVVLRRMLRHEIVSRERFGPVLSTWPRQLVTTVVFALLILFAFRASVREFPVQEHEAAVTRDPFLNKTVYNPFMALKYAIKEHGKLRGADGIDLYLPDGDIIGAAQRLFATDARYENLDDYLLKHARGPKAQPPRHIFLIVQESYDMWGFQEEYAPLRMTESLRAIADKGIFIKNFLPASATRTMPTLAAIITGLADAGVLTHYQESSRSPYPSSIAPIFRRLGYRTRFFYGGYLSWQRIGDFVRAQEFEDVYAAAHIAHWANTNKWGVDDEYLFDFVLENIPDDQPSFNLILTTSFHPPFDIDVWGKGYPVREVPPELAGIWKDPVSLRDLGHAWYADRCLGDFVRRMENDVRLPVFAITGDHHSHRCIAANPTWYERSAVPLVLYGPEVLADAAPPPNTCGSHIDIVPTLIELAAPAGFAYHALGTDLLGETPHTLGLGRQRVIGPDFLAIFADDAAFHPLPWGPLPDSLPDLQVLKRLDDAQHAISWWRIMRGPEIDILQSNR